MKLPVSRTFRLGGKLWRVKRLNEPVLDTDGTEVNGLMYYDARSIEIDGRQDSAGCASTLVHEWLEAINDQLEIGLDHVQIVRLEQGLYEILTTRRGQLK